MVLQLIFPLDLHVTLFSVTSSIVPNVLFRIPGIQAN